MMQNYTSILWVHTNEPIGEKIAVGLLFGNDETSILKLSKSKIKALKKLLDKDCFLCLYESIFPHIEYMVNAEYVAVKDVIINKRHPYGLYFFGEPSPVNLELTKENMLLLFKAMIGKE